MAVQHTQNTFAAAHQRTSRIAVIKGWWCRGGTVLAVAGDAAAGKRGNAQLASRALEAAKEAGAGRFVLITPQGGAASGGGLFGLFGGGGGSGGRSKLEQEVRLLNPSHFNQFKLT